MKECTKCNKIKSFTDFYNKKENKDGLRYACKECYLISGRANRQRNLKDPTFKERQREYFRDRYNDRKDDPEWKEIRNSRKRKWSKTQTPEQKRKGYKTGEEKRLQSLKYFDKYPEKHKAHKLLKGVPSVRGMHRHHWSYNDAHILDFIPVTSEDHSTIHRFLEYDQSVKMYRRKDNSELLDSRAKHEAFLKITITNSIAA